MHVDGTLIAALEARYGRPEVLAVAREIGREELALVRKSAAKGRTHDVTFFILDGERVVVIKKPFFPPGAYRAPSGGVKPGEDFTAGVQREAREETGLGIELDRYVLRVQAGFTCEGERQGWTTHVFSARAAGGVLAPIDTDEIAEARWVALDELQGPIRKVLLGTGRGLFAYRVSLTDATVALLRPK